MIDWQVWIIAALLFFLLEIFTAGFAVSCFSFGAIASAVAAGLGLSFLWQLGIFAVVSGLSLAFIRPLIVKLFYKDCDSKTNVDALIGRTGRVSETIDPDTGKGRVTIDGDAWKAVSTNGQKIKTGTVVRIIAFDSIIATVEEA